MSSRTGPDQDTPRQGELDDAALAPGLSVGPYRVERRLAAGGAGVVYAAVDSRDGAPIALKVLLRELSEDPVAAARFDREAEALRMLSHPHVLAVRDVGRLPDGRPYLATPLLAGRSLRAALAASGRFAPARAWEVLRAVADALAHAHARGVLHRDVKPENVILERATETDAATAAATAETARLVDFGLARIAVETQGPKLTNTGSPLGTPAYMSPEQWWNERVGPATDQYALGVLAFELLTGRLPFPDESYVAVLQHHLATPPPALASAGFEATPAMEAWVSRLLAKRPEDRYASMARALAAGDAAFGGPHPASRAATPRSEDVSTTATATGTGVATARAWGAALATLVGAPLALFAAGYGGSHQPRYLIRLAGWGVLATMGYLLAAALLRALRPHAPARWATVVVGVSGTLGTYAGWLTVIDAVARRNPGARFAMLNEGIFEANINRYLGYGFAGALALAALATRPERAGAAPDRATRREAHAIAAGTLALAAAALVSGTPSAALVSGAVAVGAALAAREAVTTRAAELARAGDHLTAVLLVGASALARVDARSAWLWTTDATRAARAAEVIAASRESTATLALSAAALLATLALAAARLRRTPAAPLRPTPRGWALLAAVSLWVLCDAGLYTRIAAERARTWSALGPAFALFAQLDPPTGEDLPVPHAAPALQLARDVVAIDASRVALRAALDGEPGRAALALDLSHRLAREGGADGPVQLLVTADRALPWSSVVRALAVAHGVGARRIELLLTRGPSPRIPASAPVEAAYVLAHDFGAVPLELDAAQGARFGADEPYARVAAALATRARTERPLRIAVGP